MSKFVTLHGFGGSGGGTELNFDVVAYDSEEVLLASTPAENTIGVVTTTPITGWYFSATQPENMVDGEVWVLNNEPAPVAFNALKKNCVMVYPVSAQQYVSGELVYVTALIYQGEAWVEWITTKYYFNYGEQKYTWSAIGLKQANASNQQAYAPTVETNEDGSVKLSMDGGKGNQRRGGYIIDELVNLTNITTITIIVNLVKADGGYNYDGNYVSAYWETGLAVLPKSYSFLSDAVANVTISKDSTTTGTLTVDVSNLTGEYYLYVPVYSTAFTKVAIKLCEVYGER